MTAILAAGSPLPSARPTATLRETGRKGKHGVNTHSISLWYDRRKSVNEYQSYVCVCFDHGHAQNAPPQTLAVEALISMSLAVAKTLGICTFGHHDEEGSRQNSD